MFLEGFQVARNQGLMALPSLKDWPCRFSALIFDPFGTRLADDKRGASYEGIRNTQNDLSSLSV
jgi:hypothetical protein